MSESALAAFTSLNQSDCELREQVRQAPTPAQILKLASEKGHLLTKPL
ncbi:Nif11-like leader peptide family natural product precursor [Synechococcus sp. AH-779-G23]|nr:Nif11-like leader peptide family natural product precursor [Synechococcus sp. AH-779-G23]MDA9638891.1 Nif11-like leader peptide family natural product precursor [Synechococcus sp. AH-779-G23]